MNAEAFGAGVSVNTGTLPSAGRAVTRDFGRARGPETARGATGGRVASAFTALSQGRPEPGGGGNPGCGA